MRPLTVIAGIILGSSLSITVSLTVVSLIFLFLADDYPRLQDEFGPLASSVLLFFCLTAISAWSFWTALKDRREKWLAQAAMWIGIVVAGFYYWP
jgi:hypothetical protein